MSYSSEAQCAKCAPVSGTSFINHYGHQTFCYAPIFMAVARFAIKLVLCDIKKQFQGLLRIFYLPWSSGFGFTTMGNKWLLGKCLIFVTLASNLGHFALEIEPKIHEINKLELKS